MYDRERRLLARLSAGRQFTEARSGGKPHFTAVDVAAGVARLRTFVQGKREADHLAQALLLYHWAGDEGEVQRACDGLVAVMECWARVEGWSKRPKNVEDLIQPWLKRMATMAMVELVNRCPCIDCSASGQVWCPGQWTLDLTDPYKPSRVWVPGKHDICQACGGLGVHPWTKQRRAAEIGTHPNTWKSTWDERYERLMRLIERTEMRGLRKLRRCLR